MAVTATDRALFERWFDELSVGDAYRSEPRAISAEEVRQFADLTGDHHPQHLDPEYAAGSQFGELIVHGMLVLSVGVGLIPVNPERTLALRRLDKGVFKRPVYIGQSIYVETSVSQLRPAGPIGLVEMAVKVKAIPREDPEASDGTLCLRGLLEAVWARADGAAD